MSHAIKFKGKCLSFPDEMNILFGDVVVSESQVWTLTSDSLTQIYENSQGIEDAVVTLEGSRDSSEKNFENNFNSSRIDSSINIEISDEGSKLKVKRKHDLSSSSNNSRKKFSKVDIISRSLDKLTGAFESYIATVKEKAKDDGGLQASVDIINALPIDKKSDFFYDCIAVLAKEKGYRKMLQILTLPEQQLGFLKRVVL